MLDVVAYHEHYSARNVRPRSSEVQRLAPLDANGVADLVRALRRRLGLTQEELARRIGVSFSTVNFWENGKRRPLPFLRRQLEKMARVAGVSLGPDERGQRRGTQEGGRR